VKWLYGPGKSPKGLKLYPGPAYGAPPSTPLPGLDPRHPADPAMALMIDPKPTWTVATFDPDREIPALEPRFAADLNATDADLSKFKARGGKLILYHGWADQLLSPYNTLDYFESVNTAMGGEAATQEFARLFMVPGMAHCGGGPGPNDVSDAAIDAMVNWVEHSQPPAQVIASRRTASGSVDRTRPLCPYPQVAKYKGVGSTDQAASFACSAP
jgi:feruloyl esterase